MTYPLVLRMRSGTPLPPLKQLGNRITDNGVRRFLDTIELSDVYWWMLMEQGPRLVEEHAAKQSAESKATLIHCAHGKDRTGDGAHPAYLCVSKEAIAKDYALSAEYGCSGPGQIMLQAMPERYRERIGEWAELATAARRQRGSSSAAGARRGEHHDRAARACREEVWLD